MKSSSTDGAYPPTAASEAQTRVKEIKPSSADELERREGGRRGKGETGDPASERRRRKGNESGGGEEGGGKGVDHVERRDRGDNGALANSAGRSSFKLAASRQSSSTSLVGERRTVVLLACGSFNPITNMHLRLDLYLSLFVLDVLIIYLAS